MRLNTIVTPCPTNHAYFFSGNGCLTFLRKIFFGSFVFLLFSNVVCDCDCDVVVVAAAVAVDVPFASGLVVPFADLVDLVCVVSLVSLAIPVVEEEAPLALLCGWDIFNYRSLSSLWYI